MKLLDGFMYRSIMEKDRGIEEFKKILRDHEDDELSVLCNHYQQNHGEGNQTIASVIIETTKGIMHVAYGNPCENEYKKFKLAD